MILEMNEGYSSKLTAHSVERSKQMILYYFVNAKLQSHIQAYNSKHGRACRGKVYES